MLAYWSNTLFSIKVMARGQFYELFLVNKMHRQCLLGPINLCRSC